MPYDKSNKIRLENSSEINEIIKTVEIGGIASPVGVSKNAVKLFPSTTFIVGDSLTLSDDSESQVATLKGSIKINRNYFSDTVTIAPNTDFLSNMSLKIKEQAAANDNTAAYGQIWVKTATPNELWFTTDAGNDIQLTSGSSLAGGSGDMEGVDLTGGTGIEIASETGTTSGSYSATINCNLEGIEVVATGISNGKVLTANGSGASTWQTPAQNSIDFDADTGATITVDAGGTLALAGGTGIDSSASGTTITHALSSGAALSNLGGGSGSTFLKKDGTWATPTDNNDDVSVINLDARLNELTATSVTVGDATDVTMNFSGGIQVGQGAVFMTEPTVASGFGVHAWTWKQGNKLDLTLINGNNQITFDTTHPAGGCNLTLKLTQPSSGAAGTISSWTATGGAYSIKWAGGSAPTLSTANNAIDIISFYFDGATYFGVASLNFS